MEEIAALQETNAQFASKLAEAEKKGFTPKTVTVNKGKNKGTYEITRAKFILDGKEVKAEDVNQGIVERLLELDSTIVKLVKSEE